MKKTIIAALFIALLTSFTIIVYAHSGRTDSSGGHKDNSTGDYHYHHGYSAHDHYDMDGNGTIDCPYTFKKTSSSSNSSSAGISSSYSSKYSSSSSSSCEGVLAIPQIALIIAPIYFIIRKDT